MTAAEAIAKLEQFDPNGVLIFTYNESGKEQGGIVVGTGQQNVETYGLIYDGIDYSEGKNNSDFIGLPFFVTGDVLMKEAGKEYSKGFDATGRGELESPGIKIGEAINQLKKRKPDAELISFNWMEIADIKQFDNTNKILKFDYEITGRFSDGNCTEGISPNKLAELVAGKQYTTGFDNERIRRREESGINMKESYKVKKFSEFVNEAKSSM